MFFDERKRCPFKRAGRRGGSLFSLLFHARSPHVALLVPDLVHDEVGVFLGPECEGEAGGQGAGVGGGGERGGHVMKEEEEEEGGG
jgi:hypothetical protein